MLSVGQGQDQIKQGSMCRVIHVLWVILKAHFDGDSSSFDKRQSQCQLKKYFNQKPSFKTSQYCLVLSQDSIFSMYI